MSEHILAKVMAAVFYLMGATVISQCFITVTVRDTTGGLISHGEIELQCPFRKETLTFKEGQVTLPESLDCSVRFFSTGFAPNTLSIKQLRNRAEVVLRPVASRQSITVSASHSPFAPAGLPLNVTVFSKHELATSAATTLDDRLRQFPGFALFRRSGSLTANPTSQGVSLRGLGASGASRTVVLQDGIPINDPFGGWVYWGRVPQASIDQVEIMEGGASDLYGSNALAGVAYLKTLEADQTAFYGESAYGSSGLMLGSGSLTARPRGWGIVATSEGLHAGGYVPVRMVDRGSVDTVASSNHQTGELTLRKSVNSNTTFFVRGNLFGESRLNGTLLQMNATTIRQLTAGLNWNASFGIFAIRLFGGTQNLHQTFSAISLDRDTETLTTDQRVPVEHYGFSTLWSSRATGRHLFSAGIDGHDITGDTNELQFAASPSPVLAIAGGRQQLFGIFGEDLFQLFPKWLIAISGRANLIEYADASSRRFPAGATPTTRAFPNRSNFEFSPRLGVTRVINSSLSLHASAYRAFRAPTLNELYRPFRVGNVSTQANENLQPEHFTGGELGVTAQIAERLNVRAAGYAGYLDDSVGNITLTSTPTLITRQRKNISNVRLRGFEVSANAQLTPSLLIQGGYEFTHSTITSFQGTPSLEGLTVPQVPRHSATFAMTYIHPRVATFVLQGRAASTEYDDDQNLLELDPYLNLGVSISREVRSGMTLFVAAENLGNSRYSIGRTPVRTIAAPLMARIGVRVYFHGRNN